MFVTYEALFAFAMFVIALVTLIILIEDHNNKKN